jgi:hypothetical protein
MHAGLLVTVSAAVRSARPRSISVLNLGSRVAVIPWTVVAVALALVAYFDLQTNFPLVDEVFRRWTLQRAIDGYGLSLQGFSPNIPQMIAAAPLAALHVEPRFWRLTGLPFLLLAAVFIDKTAHRLGADRFWAGVAAATVVASPITLSLAAGIMTETVFLGLFAAACYFAVTWVADGEGRKWCLLFCFLAVLQRQQALLLLPAVAVGLLMMGGHRWRNRVDVGVFVGAAITIASAFAIPWYFRHYVQFAPGGYEIDNPVLNGIFVVEYLPVMLGFFCLPFAVAFWRMEPGERMRAGRWQLAAVALVAIGIVLSVLRTALWNLQIFPGLVLSAFGLGSIFQHGYEFKPPLLPLPLFLALEALTLVVAWVLLGRRRALWSPRLLGAPGTLLVLAGLSQVVLMILTRQAFDRYYVMVVAPIVPVLAAVASKRLGWSQASRAWAVGLLVLGVVFFAAGEQDYIAWELAMDRVATVAYTLVPPGEVYAGHEEQGIHVDLPNAEGRAVGALSTTPRASVEFVPRSKYAFACYQSIAPGCLGIRLDGKLLPAP